MEPHFRFADFEDLQQIVAIYNSTISSHMVTADLEPVSIESRHEWFKQHIPDSFPLWVIEIDGVVAGWLSLSPFKEKQAYNKTAEISIYIDDTFRGQQIGTKTLTYLDSQLPNYSFETVVALVFGHNLTSQRLFLRHGYSLWGHLPNVAILDNQHRDLLFLGKKINEIS